MMKKKRKRTPSQLRNKRRRKKEKRQIIKSQLLIHIPQEIIDNILSRLPVKSLLLFKCVCKQWRSTISYPNFQNAESMSVFAMVNYDQNPLLYLIDNEKANLEAFPVPWDTENIRHGAPVSVSNSCNGLLLICRNCSLFLFNPSTRYFVKVLTLNRLHDLNYATTMGLCYDISINDYKAVLSLSHTTPHYGGEFVLVASLKRKRWAEINFPFKFSYVIEGPLVNGRLHWAISDSIYGNYFHASKKIICVDPCSNIFEVLPSPQPKFGDENAIVGLGVLGGCLCMARRDGEHDFKGDVEVIAMKEYGVTESWITMFVLSNFEVNRVYGGLTPLLLTKDGEVLLLENHKQKIRAYNLAKKNIQDI